MERPFLIEYRTTSASEEWLAYRSAASGPEATRVLAEIDRVLDPYDADMQSRARVRDLRL